MERNLTKTDFSNKEIIVGLDVHQKNWQASIIVEEVMTRKAFIPDSKKFADYLKKNYPCGNYIVGYEAGCFGFWIKEQLEQEGIKTIVINPADIPTSDKDKKNKTDNIDSKKIALSIKGGMVKAIYAPSRESQEYRSLVRRRYDLRKKSTRAKNQIKGLLKYNGIKYPEEYEITTTHWSKKFLDWLSLLEFRTQYDNYLMTSLIRELTFIKEEIKIILKHLKELSKEEQFKEKVKILKGIPGIGFISAMTLLSEIIDIKRFNKRDEFLNYLGLSPSEHSSGEVRKIGHLTKRCNHTLRAILIESSWIAIRKDPALMLYYNDSYKKMGKAKAIIKVAKKLAARLRYLLINNAEYITGVAA